MQSLPKPMISGYKGALGGLFERPTIAGKIGRVWPVAQPLDQIFHPVKEKGSSRLHLCVRPKNGFDSEVWMQRIEEFFGRSFHEFV